MPSRRLFVTLGFGAAFAGLVVNIPQLIWLSENKLWLFSIGAGFLALEVPPSGGAKFEPCPLDPELARACTSARRSSLVLYLVSLGIYFIECLFCLHCPASRLVLTPIALRDYPLNGLLDPKFFDIA